MSEPPEAGEQQQLPVTLPEETERRALLEAIVYVAEEPLTAELIADGLELPRDVIQADLDALVEDCQAPSRGIEIRKVAKGYKIFTKAEHHDAVRRFVKSLRPKLKLSLPALETLSVIAYKQPVTVPEIQAVRGVNVAGTIHTLLNHKLITTAGRKQVIGRPMLYKTTREFLVQFGLNDLSELPNLKELEELSRAALGEGEEEIADEAEDADSEGGEDASASEEASDAVSGEETASSENTAEQAETEPDAEGGDDLQSAGVEDDGLGAESSDGDRQSNPPRAPEGLARAATAGAGGADVQARGERNGHEPPATPEDEAV